MNTCTNPKVSVLMSVYNGERFLREAIDSILNQTFRDFEFLIINDGSTDHSREIILSYTDRRIKPIDNETNLGLTRSLNKGLDLARGEYIARMDCDDISLPARLARQVLFMDENPEVGICGTWVRLIGDNPQETWRLPTDFAQIKCRLLFTSGLAHPSAMMRQKFLKSYKLSYNEQLKQGQDYDLWARSSQYFPLRNIGEILLLYRSHSQQTGKVYLDRQQKWADTIRRQQLGHIGISPDESGLLLHSQICQVHRESSRKFIEKAESWLLKLREANETAGYFPRPAFEQVLGERWFLLCEGSERLGWWLWKKFSQSPLSRTTRLNWAQKNTFMLKCWLLPLRYGKME